MTISVNISEAARAHAEALVLSGRYGSIEQAVEAALAWLDKGWIDEVVDLDDLSPEDRVAVGEGLAEADMGRGENAEIVFERLLARYRKA